jgi:hypothetical protein
MREAQAHLTRKLRERDLGRDLEGAKITLNEYLDRWIQTAVKPRVRGKTCRDYQGMLRRYIRPHLGARVLATMGPRGPGNELIGAKHSTRLATKQINTRQDRGKRPSFPLALHVCGG